MNTPTGSEYRITELETYLFEVREPGQTLRNLSESVIREIIGDRTVDEIITIGRQEIEETALVRMSELAKRYHLGVSVNQVQLKNVDPPEPVQPSFNEVNRAQQDRENAISLANGEYNKAVPRARGEADQSIRAADGYHFKRINEAEGDAAAFSAVFCMGLTRPTVSETHLGKDRQLSSYCIYWPLLAAVSGSRIDSDFPGTRTHPISLID